MAQVHERFGNERVDVTITAATLADAEAERDRYKVSYSPLGYGTFFEQGRVSDDRAVISGYRYYSCD